MAREMRKVPWLAKRNGVFYANWYEPPKTGQDGERTKGRTRSVSLHTGDDREASLRFAAFLSKDTLVFAPGVDFCGLSVADVLDEYWKKHVAVRVVDKTRQGNAIAHLKKYFARIPIKDVDVAASHGYADARRKGLIGGGPRHRGDLAKGSDSTIRRELNVLVAAANMALKHDLIKTHELPRIDSPPEPAPDEALWLSKQEVDALYNAAQGPVQDFIALAYFTGARRAAIETLRVEQVNLANKRINLRPAGLKATKKRRPVVPIHPKIQPIVEKLVSSADRGWLFAQPVDFYKPFRAVCRGVGIDDVRAHPHVLRHSRATHLLMDGVSIYDVARLLGDTVATTERVYGHHSADYLGSTTGGD